jgi:hypothetical protein
MRTIYVVLYCCTHSKVAIDDSTEFDSLIPRNLTDWLMTDDCSDDSQLLFYSNNYFVQNYSTWHYP